MGKKRADSADSKPKETIDGATGKLDPLPLKLGKSDLTTLRGVRRAIAKVITAELDGKLEHFRARGLVWMLREQSAQIYDAELEGRLRGLEAEKVGPAATPLLTERTLN